MNKKIKTCVGLVLIIFVLFLPFPLMPEPCGCTQCGAIQQYSTIWISVVGYNDEQWHMNSTPDLINVSRDECENYSIFVWPDNDLDYGVDCYGSHLVIERRYSWDVYT